MTKRNPKQEGSDLFDCKPQKGACPLACNQCFYNRPGAFYIDPAESHMPTPEEVGEGIVRVNCGHDSNIDRDRVIAATAIYPRRFFNTSIPRFDFPAPVVFTANRQEEEPAIAPPDPVPSNIMFVRLRVSPTNLAYVQTAVEAWSMRHRVPTVLTFMAYYESDALPFGHAADYEWRVRHINSYWCPRSQWVAAVLRTTKTVGGRLVSLCGGLDSPYCRDCRNCETHYWQTIKHITECK